MGNDSNEPLKPVSYAPRPPWLPKYVNDNGIPHSVIFAKINYNDECDKSGKNKAFWTELGLRDPVVENKQFVEKSGLIKEASHFYFDPPVEDGKSLTGAFGEDSVGHRILSLKESIPVKLEDYQKALELSSPQYRQIAEKWKLSSEHPGLDVSPGLSSITHTRHANLGTPQIGHWSRYWFGPRFFDRPLNEGCVEKGLATIKYAAVAGMLYLFTMMGKGSWPSNVAFQFTPFMRLYFEKNKNILACSFIWASSLCILADIRKRDDIYNHFIIGPFTSFVYHQMSGHNTPKSVFLGLVLTLGGCIWHTARTSPNGFIPGSRDFFFGDIAMGPLYWKKTIRSGETAEKLN